MMNLSPQINTRIADRSKVFYWQTDRELTTDEAKEIWADRHKHFQKDEIFVKVNEHIKGIKLTSLSPLDLESDTSLGNVNSVRVGELEDGQKVIIRCHPKGIANGYFDAESLIAEQLIRAGLPSYNTYAIHHLTSFQDFSFQVIRKLDGISLKTHLLKHPNDEDPLVTEAGRTMAKMHKLKTNGFGPFNNEMAKVGTLCGIHATFYDSIVAGLDFNLSVLLDNQIITNDQKEGVYKLFNRSSQLLKCHDPVIVHNDFADWNLLTDGKIITGIVDLDEGISSDRLSDIACWSTFFEPKRLEKFLEGYKEISGNFDGDFEDKFELLRLRYTLSKMTLRIRRVLWDNKPAIIERINTGKQHLGASLNYFGI